MLREEHVNSSREDSITQFYLLGKVGRQGVGQRQSKKDDINNNRQEKVDHRIHTSSPRRLRTGPIVHHVPSTRLEVAFERARDTHDITVVWI